MSQGRTMIDRRSLISGRLLDADSVVAPPEGEIASILVQAKPDRLESVQNTIAAMPGCEIHGCDERGKLIVVIDALDAGAIGATLNSIALLPNVLSAALAFHSTRTS